MKWVVERLENTSNISGRISSYFCFTWDPLFTVLNWDSQFKAHLWGIKLKAIIQEYLDISLESLVINSFRRETKKSFLLSSFSYFVFNEHITRFIDGDRSPPHNKTIRMRFSFMIFCTSPGVLLPISQSNWEEDIMRLCKNDTESPIYQKRFFKCFFNVLLP